MSGEYDRQTQLARIVHHVANLQIPHLTVLGQEPQASQSSPPQEGKPMSDDFGTEWIEQDLIDALPAKLREISCQAGEPWTGDDPAADHGHTPCYFNHLAANEIERLRRLVGEASTDPSDHACSLPERCCQGCGKHTMPHVGCILR